MSEELAKFEKKLAIATTLILMAGHRTPGVRGWELRRRIGKDYQRVLEVLNDRFKDLGLMLKIVYDDENVKDFDRARIYAVVSEPITTSDLPTIGYRLDELAILSATLAYLFTKSDKAPMNEVVEVLESKFQKWVIESTIDKLVRRGYLTKTDDGFLMVGWRVKVEVDRQALLKAFASMGQQEEASSDTVQGPSSSQPQL
ncbi:MAG: hypothetical protein NZ920_01900 [Aigarchaeota archaeon]|nr:hypothetical protein [Aigarchaeota archaeon]MDW8093197.1 hypothetical protein [Nitrososphaerota archaeon]